MYEIITDAKSRASDSVIISKGEMVTAVKPGTNLYLIEAKTSEDGEARRCWVPNHWLKKVDTATIEISESVESELDATSTGEPTLSEYSSSKSFPESGVSSERSRTSSVLSSEVSFSTRKSNGTGYYLRACSCGAHLLGQPIQADPI